TPPTRTVTRVSMRSCRVMASSPLAMTNMDLHACRGMLELVAQDDDPIRAGLDAGLCASKLHVRTALDLHHRLAGIWVRDMLFPAGRGWGYGAGFVRASIPTSQLGVSLVRSCDGGLKVCAAVRCLPAPPGCCENIGKTGISARELVTRQDHVERLLPRLV